MKNTTAPRNLWPWVLLTCLCLFILAITFTGFGFNSVKLSPTEIPLQGNWFGEGEINPNWIIRIDLKIKGQDSTTLTVIKKSQASLGEFDNIFGLEYVLVKGTKSRLSISKNWRTFVLIFNIPEQPNSYILLYGCLNENNKMQVQITFFEWNLQAYDFILLKGNH